MRSKYKVRVQMYNTDKNYEITFNTIDDVENFKQDCKSMNINDNFVDLKHYSNSHDMFNPKYVAYIEVF